MNGNDKLQNVRMRSTLKIFAAALIFAALTLGLYAAARWIPGFVDGVYRDVSRTAIYGLSRATGWIPFSTAEILLYLIALSVVTSVVRLIWVLIAGPRRAVYLLRFVAWLLLYAALLAFLFCGLWGLNYRAQPLAETMGLTVRKRSTAELTELNRFLIERANRYAPQIPRDENGAAQAIDFAETAEKVAAACSRKTGRKEAPVKGVLASKPLSYTRVTGIFIPYTGEANVNRNNTPADLPFVMAHESAHRYAIAPEDEANFYAFYLLEDSDDPLLAYSAALSALIYCQNALHDCDYAAFAELHATYSKPVIADLTAYAEHWAQYEGPVSDVSETVNNTYLIVQGESDGTKSYGRMVDLMLAWYDARTR